MKSLFLATACLASATLAAAQDPLTAARDLYASASYEEALTTLTRLHEDNAAAPVAERVDQFRAFCLFALGRTTEARSVAETLITSNPLLELDNDASPRIAAMFTDVRKHLLPGLIRERYRTARTAVDKKDFAAAEPQLVRVKQMLDEANKIGASDETMADLTVLVDGFLDLARTATARANSEPDQTRTPATPSGDAPRARSVPEPTAAAPVLRDPQIFDSTSADVTAPVTIRQDFPSVPRELNNLTKTGSSGILDVVIGEKGNVERAVMREPVSPIYDGLILAATRNWKYQPAMKGTTPVKYLKSIAVVVKRDIQPPASQR